MEVWLPLISFPETACTGLVKRKKANGNLETWNSERLPLTAILALPLTAILALSWTAILVLPLTAILALPLTAILALPLTAILSSFEWLPLYLPLVAVVVSSIDCHGCVYLWLFQRWQKCKHWHLAMVLFWTFVSSWFQKHKVIVAAAAIFFFWVCVYEFSLFIVRFYFLSL